MDSIKAKYIDKVSTEILHCSSCDVVNKGIETIKLHRTWDHEVCGITCRLCKKVAKKGVNLELHKTEVHVSCEIDCTNCKK